VTAIEPLILTHPEPTPREADYWPTPRWVTEALLDAYPPGTDLPILEPAIGDGAIARVLHERSYRIYGIDIRPECREQTRGVASICMTADFLRADRSIISGSDTIITNPPFSLAREYVRACLELEPVYCALLLPASAICGTQEWRPIWTQYPATWEVRLMERPKFGESLGLKGSDRQGCVWVVWEQGQPPLRVRYV
jgi:hypothetical protein